MSVRMRVCVSTVVIGCALALPAAAADRPFGTFTYKGKIGGDEIKFSVQFNDNSFEITAKRLK